MIHPHTELKFINSEIGYGVVATKFIPAGTITWVLDKLDRSYTEQEKQSFSQPVQKMMDTYCYRNKLGDHVLCWDLGKYVNHSFKSNCLSTAYEFEIAIRDIEVGEQLTDDYGYLNVTEPFEALDEGTTRKTVYPDDLLHYHKMWDEQIFSVFPKILEVEQPLRELLTEELWKKVENLIKENRNPDSILVNHYTG